MARASFARSTSTARSSCGVCTGSWKGEPAPLFALREIATLRIEPGEAPRANFLTEKRRRVKPDRLRVIPIHMRERILFAEHEGLRLADLGQELEAG